MTVNIFEGSTEVCIQCNTITERNILHSHRYCPREGLVKHYGERFRFTEESLMFSCKKCGYVSFRKHSFDGTELSDKDAVENVKIFPNELEDALDSFKKYTSALFFPKVIREVLKESYISAKVGNLILATIGLRAIIESIVNDEKYKEIDGFHYIEDVTKPSTNLTELTKKSGKRNDLSGRINALFDVRIINQIEFHFFHKIRTYGNVAAHEQSPLDKYLFELMFKVVYNFTENNYASPRFLDIHEARIQIENVKGKDQ